MANINNRRLALRRTIRKYIRTIGLKESYQDDFPADKETAKQWLEESDRINSENDAFGRKLGFMIKDLENLQDKYAQETPFYSNVPSAGLFTEGYEAIDYMRNNSDAVKKAFEELIHVFSEAERLSLKVSQEARQYGDELWAYMKENGLN